MALKTSKRRPMARAEDAQIVSLETIGSLKQEASVAEYHQLFMSVELLMSAILDYGVQDEVITMITSSRIAQHTHDLEALHKYLAEVNASANRFHEESRIVANRAESDVYSPEATVQRMTSISNPKSLYPTESGMLVTLNITARLSTNLQPSSAKLLKAEQVYGAFWNLKAKCFVLPRGRGLGDAATAFLAYTEKRPKTKARGYRLLSEYRVTQSVYPNVEIYMMTDLPRLVALRDTKIIELSIATREQVEQIDYEERLPIIDRARLEVSRLPSVVSAESRNYIMYRKVEEYLLDNKKTGLRKIRFKRDGNPPDHNSATVAMAYHRFNIVRNIAESTGLMVSSVHEALLTNTFSSLIGPIIQKHGKEGWNSALLLAKEWRKATVESYA